jgi:hypothetical protein
MGFTSVFPLEVHKVFIGQAVTVVIQVIAHFHDGSCCITNPPLSTQAGSFTQTDSHAVGHVTGLGRREAIIHEAVAVIVDPITRLNRGLQS